MYGRVGSATIISFFCHRQNKQCILLHLLWYFQTVAIIALNKIIFKTMTMIVMIVVKQVNKLDCESAFVKSKVKILSTQ